MSATTFFSSCILHVCFRKERGAFNQTTSEHSPEYDLFSLNFVGYQSVIDNTYLFKMLFT